MKQLMKYSLPCLLLLSSGVAVGREKLPYKDKKLPVKERVADLMSRMTLQEKTAQLRNNSTSDRNSFGRTYGNTSPGTVHDMNLSTKDAAILFNEMQRYMVDSTRLGIPALTSVEGINGVLQDGCTVFPQAIAQASTFNPALIERMSGAIAKEANAMGIRQLLCPVLDVARELRWGRVEETFGEDPFLIGEIGTAFVNGSQKNGVGCMPKHFVAHGTPTGGLNCAFVAGGPRELRSIYAYPFAKVIKNASPVAIMSAYSSYDGIPVTGSKYYMTDFLRGELGFKGYLYSDWGSIDRLKIIHKIAGSTEEAGRKALMAGVDMDVWDWAYNSLDQQVEQGLLDEAYVDRACERILEAKFNLGFFDDPYCDPKKVDKLIHTPEHIALAKEVADESIVLLENNGILPLNPEKYKKIALLGPNSAVGIAGDYGWLREWGPEWSLNEALTKRLGDDRILQADGCDWWSQDDSHIAEAAKLAAESDVAIVAVGTRSIWLGRDAKAKKVTSGEGFDLSSLDLPGRQLDLLKAVKATGTPMVVVMITGKPLVMDWAQKNADAVVLQFYGGEQQGEAMTDVLFGEVNPSGKLNVSFPRSTGNTPCYYNFYPGDREQEYDKGGSLEEPNGHYIFERPYALWNFGHGKSYTTFDYTDSRISAETLSPDGTLTVEVDVKNTGSVPGKEVVQLYVNDKLSSVTVPEMMLKAFDKQEIAPGETRTFTLTLPMDELAIYDENMNRVVEPGEVEIRIGSASDDIKRTHTINIANK